MYKSKIKYWQYFLVVIFILLLTSCRTTKHVPEGEYLLKKNKISLDTNLQDISKRDLMSFIRQKPNKKIAGLKFHLWLYNLSGKDETKKINKWLRNIGEEPVLYDPFMAERARQAITNHMINRGYRHVEVEDSLKVRREKATVKYMVSPGIPYYIQHFRYDIADSAIALIILSDTSNSLVKEGTLFDIEKMEKERQRITNQLKNKGYHLFNKNDIYYEADTIGLSYRVNLTLNIRLFPFEGEDGVIERNHPVFKIKNIYIISGYNPNQYLVEKQSFFEDFDTLYRDGIHYVYKDEMKVKPATLRNSLRVHEEQIFSLSETDRTYRNLLNLRTFKLINIKYIETHLEQEKDTGYIDCHVLLNTAVPQSYSIDIEGTNYQGNLGFGSNLVYNHKNLLRGAESFSIKLRGAVEALSDPDEAGIENTVELGGDIRLSTPKLILPFKMERFVIKYNPSTSFILGYNYQQRPDYTRTIANAQIGYHWRKQNTWNYFFHPFEFDLIRLPDSEQTNRFREEVKGTYLANSFNDHLVLGSRYFFTYNRQGEASQNSFYLRYSIETGGNVMNLWHRFSEEEKIEGSYRLFDVEYTQYVKTDIDFRNYYSLNNADILASRLFIGVAYPYQNAKALPFEKKYFAGGANSLRAWQIRTLGPGSSLTDTITRFPNSFGDLRLEANIEYRFQLFWLLEAALFCDVGNIWSLTEGEDEQAQFNYDDFYKELAVGVGVGIRFDFSFFVLRFDYGVKARDPALQEDQRWILREKGVGIKNANFIFNIGYPF